MKRCKLALILFSYFLIVHMYAEPQTMNFAAPSQLPNVNYQMKTAGYWIVKHPYPDSLIMTPKQILIFNKTVRQRSGAVSEIRFTSTKHSPISMQYSIQKQFRDVRNSKFYTAEGSGFTKSFWSELEHNLNLQSTARIQNTKRALVTKMSFQRVYPTFQGCYSKIDDLEFDNWQNSTFDIGTPIVCYQQSADKNWYFGASSITIGWNLAEDIAICKEAAWQEFIACPDFVVTTSPKTDVWLDSTETIHAGFVRMGCKFPLFRKTDTHFVVKLPRRNVQGECEFGEAYIAINDANVGYLPYTPRNALIQAFKLQNEAYGWGDSNGDWDCSSMINLLFASFGIMLPRNGGFQAQSATKLIDFSSAQTDTTKIKLINKYGVGGICLLRFEGHIMLYIGSDNGIPYILHDVWGYRTPNKPAPDNVWVINKTVVSDLSLGQGSLKGSFLQRLTSLRILADR